MAMQSCQLSYMLCHKWKPPREIIEVDVNYEGRPTKGDELVDVNCGVPK